MMVMPKRMQAMKLSDELRRLGISPDLVDVEALTDASLSYPENYRNVMSRYKRTDNKAKKSKATYLGCGSGLDLSYAAQSHKTRSPHAQRMDEAFLSKGTFTERQIARDCSKLLKWYKEPGRYDIVGIDAFGYSKRRKRR